MKRYSIEKAIEKLNEAGIPIREYARAPAGKNIFIIGISDRYRKGERISLWPGSITHTEVSTDKRFEQAILAVYEESQRVVTRSTLSNWNNSVALEEIKGNWRQYMRILFPARTRCIKAEDDGYIYNEYASRIRKIKFTLVTPAEERCFLLGHDTGPDRNHVFISMLPEKATSIKEAHNILRPDEVPEGSIRQGEFYFVPAPEFDPKNRKIEKDVTLWSVMSKKRKTPKGRGHWSEYSHHLSDHSAAELVVDWVNGLQYARGAITNIRHKTQNLICWHKAIPNNEVPNPAPTRRWD